MSWPPKSVYIYRPHATECTDLETSGEKKTNQSHRTQFAMTKPLLISCIVLSLGAAALGFLNRQNLVQTEENLVATTDQKNDLSKKLTGAKKDIQGHKDEITSLSSDKDTLTANLGETQSELEKAKGETASTQKSLEDTKTDLANLQKDADAKDDRIAELEEQTSTPQDIAGGGNQNGPEAQARLTELETVNSQLQDLNSTLETQVATLRGKEEARQKVQVRQGLQGTILAVNQSWNFVVLSLGDRQGLVPNAELLIQRGGKYLGKVRVTSVESSTAIADILQRTVPRGLTVMPGDNVIYQAQRN